VDEPRHIGAPAPAEPKIPREAETGTLSPGEGAPAATAPSLRDEAAPPPAAAEQTGVIEEQGATAAADAPVARGADSADDIATEFAAVPPAEVAAERDHEPAPAALEEDGPAGPAPEPGAEPEPEREPRVAGPPHPAEPEPEAVAAAEAGSEPLDAAPVAEAGPEPVDALATAEAAPEPAVPVAEAEPEPAAARQAVPMPEAAGAERAGTQTAQRTPEPGALPWAQASEASATPIAPPLEPPARPLPVWPPAWQPSLPSRETVVAYLRLAVRVAAAVTAGLVGIVLMLVVLYRWVDPPVSTLMLGQRLAGTPIERSWVPLGRISPHLIKAVVLSEDGAFCRHRGVDWMALGEAIESDRGGSTITMQVVKNLFLWPSRSYVRKVIEIGLAYLVELIWPKRRILEIYLNIAEWGDGVFGAEAAARWHFGKSAAQLTAAEAALLAVALPNPTERTAGSPSLAMSRLAKRLQVRMTASRASLGCVRTAPRLSRQAHLLRAHLLRAHLLRAHLLRDGD
jgi:monofunctional glycosyltransferase